MTLSLKGNYTPSQYFDCDLVRSLSKESIPRLSIYRNWQIIKCHYVKFVVICYTALEKLIEEPRATPKSARPRAFQGPSRPHAQWGGGQKDLADPMHGEGGIVERVLKKENQRLRLKKCWYRFRVSCPERPANLASLQQTTEHFRAFISRTHTGLGSASDSAQTHRGLGTLEPPKCLLDLSPEEQGWINSPYCSGLMMVTASVCPRTKQQGKKVCK